jgi:serine/threonine-protein kinase
MGATSTGSMLGTPFYMSPEQLLSSRSVDFRSDLWSLGVVAYQALTGHRPFNGETVGALSVAVNMGVYPIASGARSGLSASIDAWIQKALQRNPANRFNSAREMSDEFEKAVRDPLRGAGSVDVVDPARASLPGEYATGGGPLATTGGGRLGTTGSGPMGSTGSGPMGTTGSGPLSASRNSSPSTNPQIAQTGPTLEGTASTGTEARQGRRRAPLVIGVGALAATLVAGGLYLRGARSHPGPTDGTGVSGVTGATGAPQPSVAPTASAPSVAATPSVTVAPSATAAPKTGPDGSARATIDLDDGEAGAARKRAAIAHVPPPATTKPATTPTATTPKKDTIGF